MPHIETDIKLDFKDVLIRPKRSTLNSRSQVDVQRTFHFRNVVDDPPTSTTTTRCCSSWTGVPIVAANMDTVGTFEMAVKMAQRNMLVCIHKHYTVQDWADFATTHPHVLPHVAVSAGTSDADLARVAAICASHPTIHFICLDIANGYSAHFLQVVTRVRATHASHVLIAGNVVTREMTEALVLAGADVVKVGIGPGSVCTTRRQTGVGYPQLSAILECADAAHGVNGHVMADGGCTCPGDVAKALGAGADFVMLGGVLAGHDESGGGDVVTLKDGSRVKPFYGMSSRVAMTKHVGGVANYRSSEGKAVVVPYRGPVDGTLAEILGGLRSTCTYVGASTLAQLSKCTTFIRVTQQLNDVFGPAPNDREVVMLSGAGGAGGSHEPHCR